MYNDVHCICFSIVTLPYVDRGSSIGAIILPHTVLEEGVGMSASPGVDACVFCAGELEAGDQVTRTSVFCEGQMRHPTAEGALIVIAAIITAHNLDIATLDLSICKDFAILRVLVWMEGSARTYDKGLVALRIA